MGYYFSIDELPYLYYFEIWYKDRREHWTCFPGYSQVLQYPRFQNLRTAYHWMDLQSHRRQCMISSAFHHLAYSAVNQQFP